MKIPLYILFITLLMVACTACGATGLSAGRGFTAHLNKCKVLKEQRARGAQQLVAADAAAAEAAVVAHAAQQNIPLENMIIIPAPRPLLLYHPALCLLIRVDVRSAADNPPKRFQDEPPTLPSIVEPPEIPDVPAAAPDESGTELRSQTWVKTKPNRFGLYKVFPNRPTHDPDESISLDDLCKSPELLVAPKVPSSSPSTPPWHPFLNSTVARLMSWFHLGSNLKSIAELDSLVDDVLLKDDFNQEHLRNFKAARENKRMDDANGENSQDGWQKASVKIKLPAHNVCVPEADAAEFEVEGLLYRPLLDVMTEAFQSPAFEQFHITPFQYRWDPHYNPDDPDISLDPPDALDEDGLPQLPNGHQKVYGEIYTSDPMLRAHNKLRMTTPHLETVIAAYMFWSDSTHLANFGNASLWPLYTFFGNLSKYIRAKPTANAAYHQAYFPSVRLTFYFCFAVSHDFQLPDSLKDFYREKFGSSPSSDMWAHLKRELMHAIWDLLISEEFIHAYINGIVIKCYDGVEHLVFPRFFTYGADYPEKVLLATIKYFGGCPCPRCFIEKDKIPEMGTKADMRRRQNTRQDTTWYRFIINLVRRWIFEHGFLVAGAAVARNLKQYSWVPTRNAFSKLAVHGFNFYSMFVPDLLHEVELGGWKSLFAHLVRILQAEGEHLIDELDARFRKMPTFGRSTIRRFHANVSEMKKMAARDFEDILQGLLPEPHNTIILTLIYVFATWHAYAKLRMHTDSSVTSFRAVTRELGAQARHFLRTTCHRYTTYELPSEYNRRARRHAQKNAKSGSTTTPSKLSKERKTWNICTYKWHSLGDYTDAIVHVGTHDSYSTLTGELAHRHVKKFYAKTNKRNFVFQIGAHEHRRRLALQVKKSMDAAGTSKDAATEPAPHIEAPANQHAASIANIHTLLASENDKLPPSTPPKQHHHISESKRTFLQTYELPKNDTATKDFLPNLKAHLLNRLLEKPYDGDETQYSLQELADVNIIGERLYTHKVMRINFTTYDCLRDSDTLNPRTRPDFIVQAHEDEDETATHPYWYGRIIGIFHASVRHVGPLSKNRTKVHRMEFLWVRWFGRDLSHPGGWKYKRLHRVGFLDASEPDSGAFGFLDPAEVIRAAHLIPAFHFGRTSRYLGTTVARMYHGEDQQDYNYYYVNPFVDRDMFMRYSDDAVGHVTRRKAASVKPLHADEQEDEMDVDLPPMPHQATLDVDEAPGLDGPLAEPDSGTESDSEESEQEEANDEEPEAEGVEVTNESILDANGIFWDATEYSHVIVTRTLKAPTRDARLLSATTMSTPGASSTTSTSSSNAQVAQSGPAPVPPSAAKRAFDEIVASFGDAPVVPRASKKPKRDTMETKTPLNKLLSMAKYFPRAVHLFLDIGLALHYGAATCWTVAVSSDPSNTITLPEEERVAQKQLVNAFETMVSISIESVDVLREVYKEERQWGLIVRKFRKAAADARQSDTHNLEHKLQYLPSDPTKPITPAISNGELKSDRGVNHPMIRDAIISWRLRRKINEKMPAEEGEEAELTPAAIKALKALLNGGLTTRSKPAMKAKSWPSCFYADGAYDSNDPQAGLFRSLFLLRVARHLWTAPSSAMDGAERIKAICVARAHGQYRFTKEMLGYGCTMLSTSDWTSRDGKYNYEDLFDNILELFEDPTDTWAIETLGWFQKGVFGGAKVSGSDNGDNNDDSDDSDSEMATIRARRRAACSSESSSESG
ncbi:GLOBIN domain-containing protein [Mycena venus]|uniref:GLOBIN domain-containing protein n=1 Tax=Mycena venus TaxID=2733690 RepID=A0A8H6XJ51_9AGAR|nr:GLOBIN domain-containing protein [Mycena venus]